MQFEEFDNKIREAAENHHPAYDENAWARMENLLDKHLPQEDDRRTVVTLENVPTIGKAEATAGLDAPACKSEQADCAKYDPVHFVEG